MAPRRRYKDPKLAKLRTIPDLAIEVARPYRTLFGQLLQLHKQDVENGEGGWLFRLGVKKYFINLSRLRQAHPALFESWYVERDEFNELAEQVKKFRAATHDLGVRERATAARVANRLATLDQKAANADQSVARIEQKLTRIEQKKIA